MSAKLLYGVAGVLLALLLAAVAWLLLQGGSGGIGRGPSASGTNPALDVRFRYNPRLLRPAAYDSAAEFPLQLDGADFSFYAKRIRGVGEMLGDKAAQPMLYDFVGSQQNDLFEYWYRLKPEGKPLYEDARLQGRLALHTVTVYDRVKESRGWPPYFPRSVTGDTPAGNSALPDSAVDENSKSDEALDEETENQVVRSIAKAGGVDKAYVESWALYTKSDLFFFYAVSPHELTSSERDAVINVINSLQFNAVMGSATAAPKAETQQKPAQKPAMQTQPAPGGGVARREVDAVRPPQARPPHGGVHHLRPRQPRRALQGHAP